MANPKSDADRLKAENTERLKSLRDDHGIVIDMDQAKDHKFKMMIQALFDNLLTDNQRAKVEVEYQQIIGKSIDHAEASIEAHLSQQRQAALLQGVPGVSPLQRPGG